jgi:hypothetical protein
MLGSWTFLSGWIIKSPFSSTKSLGTFSHVLDCQESRQASPANGRELTLWIALLNSYSIYRRIPGYYNDNDDAYDMRKPLKRDKDRKHVRENGENHLVDPGDVW